MGKAKEYMVWQSMKARCYKKQDKSYPRYGGRGITMSDEWKNSYKAFIEDMGKRPEGNLTIERIDNNGGYNKENCKWATYKEQRHNQRKNDIYSFMYRGITLTTANEIAKFANLCKTTVYARLQRKWPIEKIIELRPSSNNKSHRLWKEEICYLPGGIL